MSEPEIEIPVAFCPKCDELRPVWVSDISLDIEGESLGEEIPFVICPECETILSLMENVEVKYYSIEDVEKVTGWKATYGE